MTSCDLQVIRLYAEEADDDANKVSQRPEAHPAGERIANKVLTLPVITANKVVTYKRIGISLKKALRADCSHCCFNNARRLTGKYNHKRNLPIRYDFVVGIVVPLRP